MTHRLDFLLSSLNDTADLLKGVAHPQRIKILLYLYYDTVVHNDLADELEIPKSTLSHHLNTLQQLHLVDKKERGKYTISPEGARLVASIGDLILELKYHENERNAVQLKRYESLLSKFGEDTMKPEIHVDIVELPESKVIAVQVLGKEPETKAWKKMETWLKKNNFNMNEIQIYGSNNPDPQPGKAEYGYEFYVPTTLNLQEDDTIKIKTMPGGTYAVHKCEIKGDFEAIGKSWKALVKWVKDNDDYEFNGDYCYEHHPNPNAEPKDFVLNLYLPVKKI
ncbi:MAG: effector binding domain-containing protein [Candidatus Heimdallarchaeota archaeon]|nr:effector binding domain-containing protein [Candidatus Heimdallarchaeota archaeon]